MKIRADYVTNSSTTSYVIISDGDFSKRDMLDLMGIEKGSPLEPLAEGLYEALYDDQRRSPRWKIAEYYGGNEEAYIKDQFSEKVLLKVKEAKKQGKRVFIGSLASDNTEVESLFCCSSFEWENDKLYIYALDCVW